MSLPEGWIGTTLGEVCQNISRRFDFLDKKEVVFINTGDVLAGKFLHKKYISKIGLPGQAKKAIKKGDILYSEIRPKNKRYAIVDFEVDDFVVSTKFMVLKKNDNIDLDFLYLFVTSKKILNEFNHAAESRSGTFPQITFDAIKYITIKCPPLQEQKAIANILSSFDEKIELLKEQNETLEEMAQGVFREWFVDGVDESWEKVQLRDISEKISKGTTPRKKDVEGLSKSTVFLKVKDITDNGNIKLNTVEKIPFEIHLNALKRSRLETDDILYSIAGTIGRVAILPKDLNDSNCNQALAFIRLKNKELLLEYVYLWFKTREVKTEIESSIVQGVQANVSLTVLGNLELYLPDGKTMSDWNDLIKPIYEKVKNNISEIQTLQKTRDTLLPKLMSGELRVEGFV